MIAWHEGITRQLFLFCSWKSLSSLINLIQCINGNCYQTILSNPYIKIFKSMDIKELAKIKDQGNDLFKQKKYQQAITKFKISIAQIENQENKDYLAKDKQISKLYVVCLINAALACINIKDLGRYEEGIGYCDKALSVDGDNIKGLYRRGLARKEKAEIVERESGVKAEGLLQLYQKAREDFQRLCLVDKTNQLATKTLKLIMNDIYRVTVGRGQEVFKSSSAKVEKKQQKHLEMSQTQKPRKKGDNMAKIMEQYKVEEATSTVQEKVRSHYLTNELPALRSEFQKAIRTLEKSQQTYIQFAYRINQQYLNKIAPTFDLLGNLVAILIKKGSGEDAKRVFLAIQKQKAFKLLWKSYGEKNKEILRNKWKELQLPEQSLNL